VDSISSLILISIGHPRRTAMKEEAERRHPRVRLGTAKAYEGEDDDDDR